MLPLWPAQALLADVVEGDGEAAPVGIGEIVDRLLPFLVDADANISLFPNFDDDMLIEPAAEADGDTGFIDFLGEIDGSGGVLDSCSHRPGPVARRASPRTVLVLECYPGIHEDKACATFKVTIRNARP